MKGRTWFWLYRPTAPSVRAQSVQVLHMAHAMASRGHEVHLAVEPGAPGATAQSVLSFYGLEPVRGLRLTVLPASRTLASALFRGLFAGWVLRSGGQGIVYARSKRYAAEALRLMGGRSHLVVEAHEVDSLQAAERGEDPEPHRRLEARVLGAAAAVVCNAPGTLRLLEQEHVLPPALACPNATHPSRQRHPTGPGQGIGYTGSNRAYKGLETLARAAALTHQRVHLVGADDASHLQELAQGRLVLEPAVDHASLPDRLAAFRALALPLAPGLFGEQLTSPLKLWDYLASGRPVVGADLPSLREQAPGAFLPYRTGDAEHLAQQLDRACEDEALRAELIAAAPLRTWGQRAAEIEAFLDGVLS